MKTICTIQDFNHYCGTPFNQVPLPNGPFRWTTGYKIAAGIGVFIFLVGIYQIYKWVTPQPEPKNMR